AKHDGGRSPFAPGGTPLMITIGAKKLLQIIVGTGTLGDAIAVKQAWPVALADLQKVPDRWGEAPGFSLMLPHGSKQPVQPALHSCLRALGVVVQDVRGAMHPAIGHPHLGPQRRRRVQPTPPARLQAPESFGQGPVWSKNSKPARQQSLQPYHRPLCGLHTVHTITHTRAKRGQTKWRGTDTWIGRPCWRISRGPSIKNCSCAMS